MNFLRILLILFICSLLSQCFVFEMEEEDIPRDSIGFLEVEFIIPDYDIPKGKIHLVDLSVASSRDSAVQGFFIQKANVSDSKHLYQFELLEGEYFFSAAISCACLGDTCLEQGFPGGKDGIKYSIANASVEGGKTIRYFTSFD